MRVRVDRRRETVAVSEQPRPSLVAVHKYAVVRDARKDGIAFGTHADATALEGIAVRHTRSTKYLAGRLAGWTEPGPAVEQELAELGAEVVA